VRNPNYPPPREAVPPEEFSLVLTVFLALGAWRIAQRQVLTHRMPAIETLGAATVLCVDKTGTLTQNRMTVRSLYTKGSSYQVQADVRQPLPDAFHELVACAELASQQDPFDPMEQALRGLSERTCLEQSIRPTIGRSCVSTPYRQLCSPSLTSGSPLCQKQTI
jgi:magnesium-transporting ATPase (P-type)